MSDNLFPVPSDFPRPGTTDKATYEKMYKESVEDPEGFWGRQAERITWFKKWDKVLEHDFPNASHQWFLVKLGEGRNREVRRLWESQGVQVSRLKRTAYGPVRLSNRLARGRSQEMDPISVKQLLQLVGLQAPMSAQAAQRKNSGRHTGAKRKPSKPAR